jgi:hypothetical protein
MPKKKKENLYDNLMTEEFKQKQIEYLDTIKNNPQYSLIVDPENKYNLTLQQKEFIGLYCEFKNIQLAAMMSNLELEEAMTLYSSYPCQQEIRRINLAMYQTQFANKLISLNELGGYLTSLLCDAVPSGDKLSPSDKLKVAQLILDLNKTLKETPNEVKDIVDIPIDTQIKDLSIKSIKALLEANKNKDKIKEEKEKIIESFENFDNFSQEEISFLNTLSTKELLDLLNSMEKETK